MLRRFKKIKVIGKNETLEGKYENILECFIDVSVVARYVRDIVIDYENEETSAKKVYEALKTTVRSLMTSTEFIKYTLESIRVDMKERREILDMVMEIQELVAKIDSKNNHYYHAARGYLENKQWYTSDLLEMLDRILIIAEEGNEIARNIIGL